MAISDILETLLNPKRGNELAHEAGLYPFQTGQRLDAPTQPTPQQPARQPNSPRGGVDGFTMSNRIPYNRRMAEEVFAQYTAAGYDPRFAAGMAANAQIESAGNPTAFNQDEGAFGLFQWRDDRQQNMRDFAATRGNDAHDLGGQVSFSIHELENFEREAYGKIMGYEPATAPEYARLIDQYYERSDGKARNKRAALAGQIYTDFVSPEGVLNPKSGHPVLAYGNGATAFQDTFDMQKSELPYPVGVPTEAPNMGPASGMSAKDEILFTPSQMASWVGGEDAAAPNEGVAGGGIHSAPAVAMADTNGATNSGAKQGEEEKDAFTGPFAKFLDTIYKTDNLSNDEERARRRAIGLALAQGLSSLSTGAPADYAGIATVGAQQRSDIRKQKDRMVDAQAMSDMLVTAGYPERAQLPFMGDEGFTAAVNMLSGDGKKGGDFQLDGGTRAIMAQTAADRGRPDLATVLNNPNITGSALESVYKEMVGAPPSQGTEKMSYTPEQRAGIAAYMGERGMPEAAQMITAGVLPDESITGMLESIAGMPLTVAEAGAVKGAETGAQLGAEAAVTTGQAAAMSSTLEGMGMTQEAQLMKAAPDVGTGLKAITTAAAQQQAAEEAASIKARAEAAAAVVPDDAPNAAAIKEFARRATTSEDLNNVFKMIADDPKATEEKLYEAAKGDPGFMKFIMDKARAQAGNDPAVPYSQRLFMNEITQASETYVEQKAVNRKLAQDMSIVKTAASNPSASFGVVQEQALIPAQRVLTSLFGTAAPELASDPTLIASRFVDTMKNQHFATMAAGLKGAISDRETAAMMKTLPAVGDTRTQLLAIAQYHIEVQKIRDAEYAAMLEYMEGTEGKGMDYNRADMMKYVDDKTKDMRIFQQTTTNDVASFIDEGVKNGTLKVGDVFEVMDPKSGKVSYVAYGNFPQE